MIEFILLNIQARMRTLATRDCVSFRFNLRSSKNAHDDLLPRHEYKSNINLGSGLYAWLIFSIHNIFLAENVLFLIWINVLFMIFTERILLHFL